MQTQTVAAAPSPGQQSYGGTGYKAYVLVLLFLVYALYALDRSIINVLVEPIKNELHLTDSQMGIIMGPAFSVCFALFGIPLGILSDRSNRRNIIAACVGLWSIATGLCGLAQNFIQMTLGRIAVGTGISGGTPASMAIISDIFPATQRATALSVFYAGGAFGAVTAFGGGSWIAAQYGWRTALMVAMVPGIFLSAMLYLTVREPLRGLSDGRVQAGASIPVTQVLRFIWNQRSIVHMILGLIFLHAVGNGAMAFFASFMIRSHGMTLGETGAMISLLYLVTTPISQICAGLLADFLGRFDERWRIRLGSIGSVLSLIAISSMMIVESKTGMAIAFACWAFSTGIYQSPIYALLQTLVKPQMRATIGSIQFVVTAAIGGALGPLFVGMLSDHLSIQYGLESLRYAIFALGLFYLWAAAHFMLGERHVRSDLARAASN